MLTLQVRDSVRKSVPTPLRAALRRQVGRAMRAAGVESALVSLTLSDDAELHELNRIYAEEDHPTDVLSFAQRDADPGVAIPLPPGTPETLGDVIISVEIACDKRLRRDMIFCRAGTSVDSRTVSLAGNGSPGCPRGALDVRV
jgi:ssRNA-specific RNase YbeY (16S rRNA maturation enzyme)